MQQSAANICGFGVALTAKGGKRMRRIGIVALARKLLVSLWKYLEHGEMPEGAVFGG